MTALVTIEHDVILRTARRFAIVDGKEQKPTYHYVAMKLRRDPATQAVAALAPLGDILDIGCGRGHLALFLLECAAASRVRGFDWDARKVAIANHAAAGLDATFEKADMRGAPLESADTVLLVDVLHYLSVEAQDELLDRAADAVRPGGRLVIRDAAAGRGWRSLVTRIFEWIGMAIRLNLGERMRVRDVAGELVPRLEARGMTCTVEPCWKGTPFSNVLLVAAKSASNVFDRQPETRL